MNQENDNNEQTWEEAATSFLADPPPLAASSRAQACLIVLAGGPIGQMIMIGDGISIGRSPEADFHIQDGGVSRIHLRVERTPDHGARVVDQGSRNGTFVNRRRVGAAVLNDGDKIYIGTRAILRFCYADHLEEDFQRQMYEAALRDSLTGLFNRRHLMAQLDTELQLAMRHEIPLTVVLIDVDHFKTLNDRYGHLIGDSLLQGLGKHLRDGIRGTDFAARYGGEEFVIVCRGTGGESGVRLVKRLQQSLRDRALVEQFPGLHITFSAGVSSAPHPEVRKAADLLRRADEALYRAKGSGRDCVRICE